jgi:hypothetical protein
MAQGLATLRQPDLSAFPADQVRDAVGQMFPDGAFSTEFLTWLRERVAEYSGSTTQLTDADPNDFAYLSKEWGAVYQRLTGPDGDQLIIIGNTVPPFLFVPKK